MGTRIQIRRDTSTNWSLNNPVLAIGEPGLETDTQIVKYGDGVTSWNNLPYSNLNSLADFTTANLIENSANLYYTNARVYSNILNLNFATNAQIGSFATNAQLASYATNSQLSLYATNAQLSTYATNNQLSLYATNAQLGSYSTNAQLTLYASNAQIATKANISDLNTSNVVEGSNHYFSNTRVKDYLEASFTNIHLSNVITLNQYSYDLLPTSFVTTFNLVGALVFDSSNNVFRGWNGSSWTILG